MAARKSGTGFLPPTSGLASNPFRVGGRPSAASFDSMAKNQGFKVVSPADFQRLTAMGRYDQGANSAFSMLSPSMFGPQGALSEQMNPVFRRDPTEPTTGDEEPPKGLAKWLTGQRGAAVGGIAQGVGSVIGGYLQNRQESKRLEEEKRRRKIEEENNRRIQELLMPMITREMERYRSNG